MNDAYISALAALAGSGMGAFASVGTTGSRRAIKSAIHGSWTPITVPTLTLKPNECGTLKIMMCFALSSRPAKPN